MELTTEAAACIEGLPCWLLEPDMFGGQPFFVCKVVSVSILVAFS